MTIVIDPKAGRHFDGKEIAVTTHAVEQAKKRFNVPWKKAEDWIRENLRKAQYIGEILADGGKENRLFGYNRICFVLDIEKDLVITVYERRISSERLKNVITKAVKGELSRIERVIKRKQHEIERIKAELKIEIGELELARLATRSEAKRLAYTARINALKMHFDILDADLNELKREQSKLRKGVVCYV